MKIINRQAKFNYQLFEKIEAGIVLTGSEVKSIRAGQLSLKDAFVRIDPQGEVWLVNAHIPVYQLGAERGYQPARSRKLLLHRSQILNLERKMAAKNLTLVPTACYSARGRIKLEIALAKGRKKWQKKEKIKKRDLAREAEREISNKLS